MPPAPIWNRKCKEDYLAKVALHCIICIRKNRVFRPQILGGTTKEACMHCAYAASCVNSLACRERKCIFSSRETRT